MFKRRASFLWLFIPLTMFVAVMVLLLVERAGVVYENRIRTSRFLAATDVPVKSGYSEPAVESLLLYDSKYPAQKANLQMMRDTLDSMRVRYDEADINAPGKLSFDKYQTVVLVFHDYNNMKQWQALVDWVEKGGRVMAAMRPFFSENYFSLYRKMGILSIQDQETEVLGLVFQSDLVPGSKGVRLEGAGDFLLNRSYPLQLDPGAHLYLTAADEYSLPILWSKDYGKGRFVVINTDLFNTREFRGILGGAYSLLSDVFVYPVINSAVYFVDDFPAPIPEGNNPEVTKEYKLDIRSWLIEVWWPDMQNLAKKYNVKYTGLLVETYNNVLNPPFYQEVSVDDHRYLGRLLLKMGGEIGLHGYNHVPLCVKADGVNKGFGYPDWPSIQNGTMSLQVLNELGHTLFPGETFSVYVPPSNVLCPEARKALPKALPDLKVISSLLLMGGDANSYIQDFKEADDGIIEFPRIVSGYFLYEEDQLALLGELGLHYVYSHFIHPDDLLDTERRENRTWKEMRDQLDNQMAWVSKNTPGMKSMTVDEAAMATQRFSRLKVNASLNNGVYTIHLGNFYDEAALMMRSAQAPITITGGKITKVTDTLYLITADKPDIQIEFK